MGKYKHEGKDRNISVSGGRERKDLFKDMSGGYNAMGDSNSPNYKYNGSAFKQRYSKSPAHKELVGKQNSLPSELKAAIEAAPEMKGSPMYKRKHQVYGVDSKASEPKGNMKGLNKKTAQKMPEPKQTARIETRMKTLTPLEKSSCTSGGGSKSPYKMEGDPKNKLKGKINKLSDKHKKLYSDFDMGRTDGKKLGKVEDKLERKEKKYTKKYGSSPYNMMDNPTDKPKGKMKKEGKLKATMTKTMRKLPTKQAAKISGPYKNK
jgi:hypothetical protein